MPVSGSWGLPSSAPSTVAPAPGQLDHLGFAFNRLAQQYRNRPNIAKLITAMAGEFQAIESMFDDLRRMRWIASSVGVQLDGIGRLVGAKRNGLSDASYRARLFAQVLLNISSGSPEDIYAILAAMLSNTPGITLLIQEYFPAMFIARVGGAAVPNPSDVATVLQLAKDCGVRVVLEYTTDTDANSFDLEPIAAFLSGATLAGALTMPIVAGVGTSGFPVAGGSLLIDKGLASEETLAYSAFDGATFTTSAATKAHVAGATLQLVGSIGKGYGDTGDASVGGSMAGAI